MAEKKIITLAIEYDENDNVVSVCKVLNCNQATYNSIKNRHNDYLQGQLKEKEKVNECLLKLENKCKKLEEEIKLLKGEE